MLRLRAALNNARFGAGDYPKFTRVPGSESEYTHENEESENGHAALYAQPRWQKTSYGFKGRIFAALQTKRARVLIVLFIVVVLVLSLFDPLVPPSKYPNPDPTKPRHLRLLLPATEADQNLCKTLVSAAVLGYSSPTIINWNQTFNDSTLIFGGSHLAKINGVLDRLESLDNKYDNDIVLLVDGYDVWFQLRPNVLIERFFRLNKQANRRLIRRYGRGVAARNGFEQRVIFSAQKKCWPKSANHPSCWAIPDSPLPLDLYGPETDTDIKNPLNPFEKFRPRYLNSGSVIGTVADVRKLFQRVAAVAAYDKSIGSDQGVFATIYGEQEFHRHWAAMSSRTLFRRFLDFVLKAFGKDYSYRLVDPARKGTREFFDVDPTETYEYGIGLDYDGRLVQATVFSEDDTAWIAYDDRPEIQRVSSEKQIPGPPRVHGLPPDVRNSLAPFYTPDGGGGAHGNGGSPLPLDKTWKNVPLLTNMWTGISPVAVHHDAHHDGLKERIHTHWNRTWFFPYGRALLTERLLSPQKHIAVTKGDGGEHMWFNPAECASGMEWRRVATDKGDNFQFSELCAGTWGELFRDNRGEWEMPAADEGEAPPPDADYDDDDDDDDPDEDSEPSHPQGIHSDISDDDYDGDKDGS